MIHFSFSVLNIISLGPVLSGNIINKLISGVIEMILVCCSDNELLLHAFFRLLEEYFIIFGKTGCGKL